MGNLLCEEDSPQMELLLPDQTVLKVESCETADDRLLISASTTQRCVRNSEIYHALYNQRTADERINSQAKAMGIETPKLRNQHSIARMNTLRYVLINLRGLQRVRKRKAALDLSA